MKQEPNDNSILAASFWENWKYFKELSAMKSSKAEKQRIETEKIRQEWINAQNNI